MTDLLLNRASLIAFASATAEPAAGLQLRSVLKPLWELRAAPLAQRHRTAHERDLTERLRRRLRAVPPTALRPDLRSLHDRRMFDEGEADLRLRYRAAPPAGLGRVFAQYGKRLPTAWQRWLWWAHRCYEHAIPRTVPALIEAFEALIAIEAQLQVDGNHANRDHVVHQLADAELAVKLHTAAAPGFDDHDWDALCAAVPSARALDPSTRAEVTRCGLALAGLFHDVGYLRYVGDGARHALSTGFGLAAPGPSFDLWEVMRELAGTYLDHILSPGAGGSDGLVAELFAFAWENGWHGALSARLLISVGRKLRGEGRATPRVDAAMYWKAYAQDRLGLRPEEFYRLLRASKELPTTSQPTRFVTASAKLFMNCLIDFTLFDGVYRRVIQVAGGLVHVASVGNFVRRKR